VKILLVTEYFPTREIGDVRGGAETRSFYLAKYLVRRGHKVTVLASHEPGQPRSGKVVGACVLRCGHTRPFSQGGSIIGRLTFAREAAKRGLTIDTDVVDGHSFLGYIPAWHIARRKGVPAVATYHDIWLSEWIKNVGLINGVPGELWERYVLLRAWDHFIAVSQVTKAKLIQRVGIPDSKISVVPNGIELRQYQKIKVEKFSRPTVVYVGRLVRYKYVDELLRAVSLLRQDFPDVQIKIIGTGPERKNLEKLCQKLGFANRVEFLGFVARHRDVLTTIKRAHVFCFPSTVEGFGIVVLEALALGVPYVASDILPIREATGGIGGLLVPPRDIQALADGIRQALRGKVDTSENTSWAQGFEWRKLAHRVETVYNRLL
jgi:glycosyltransferase involved in cell wall biosynthesis